MDYTVRRLVPFSANAVEIMMRLSIRAGQAFASERTSFEQKSILTNRGRHLVNTLCSAYGCGISGLEEKLGRKSREKVDQLLNSDTPVSFRFLENIYRKARKDLHSDQAYSVFKAIRAYNPVFSIFIATGGYRTSDTLKRLTYLETKERNLEEYLEWALIKFRKAGGDSDKIDDMNKYCATPNNNWLQNPNIKQMQRELLLTLWADRDALTGELLKLVDSRRHHYRILYKLGSRIGYIKFDCRLQALVPLSVASHGAMNDASNAKKYEEYFKEIMENLMKGEWAIPYWWQNLADIKEFEKNLLRLGFVKPT